MALFLSLTTIVLCIFLYEVDPAAQRRTIDGIKYYVDYTKGYNWHEAMRFCAYNKMYLVDIRTSIENSRITTFVNETRLKFDEKVIRFWTSGSDLACNRTFTWLTSGERVSFTNWHTGEPNNDHGFENCISLEWRNFEPTVIKWNDYECNQTAYIICRYNLDIPLRLNVNWEEIN